MKTVFYAGGYGVSSETMAEGLAEFLILQHLVKAEMKIDHYQIFIFEVRISKKQMERLSVKYKKQAVLIAVDETTAIAFANTRGMVRLRQEKIEIIKELSAEEVLGIIPAGRISCHPAANNKIHSWKHLAIGRVFFKHE
jgi:hypothetical protein